MQITDKRLYSICRCCGFAPEEEFIFIVSMDVGIIRFVPVADVRVALMIGAFLNSFIIVMNGSIKEQDGWREKLSYGLMMIFQALKKRIGV